MAVSWEYKAHYGIEDLVKIVALLRGEGGCPWDREQNHHSIRKNFLEETCEVLEAIDTEDALLLREELGDVLLQVVFHAQMETEAGSFGFNEVCDGICQKLILRHPHVFGGTAVSGTGEVLQNWDRIKQESKGQTTASDTLRSVPATLPALMRAEKIQRRAAKSGFRYADAAGAMKDLESELAELKEAMTEKDTAHIEEELGDLLFSVVNVARHLECDPEEALGKSCSKFIERFSCAEGLAGEKPLKEHTAEELDMLWKRAKGKLEEGGNGIRKAP